MSRKGFPLTAPCEHGAGAGCICERCAGPVNLALQMFHGVDAVVEGMLKRGADPELLTEAVRIRDQVLNWATDRRVCFAAVGPCACVACVGDVDHLDGRRRTAEGGGSDG